MWHALQQGQRPFLNLVNFVISKNQKGKKTKDLVYLMASTEGQEMICHLFSFFSYAILTCSNQKSQKCNLVETNN